MPAIGNQTTRSVTKESKNQEPLTKSPQSEIEASSSDSSSEPVKNSSIEVPDAALLGMVSTELGRESEALPEVEDAAAEEGCEASPEVEDVAAEGGGSSGETEKKSPGEFHLTGSQSEGLAISPQRFGGSGSNKMEGNRKRRMPPNLYIGVKKNNLFLNFLYLKKKKKKKASGFCNSRLVK